MVRPTVLVAEPEPTEGVSARKLVLETAKFNVITAHSGTETNELFDRFPSVDAVVLHTSLRGLNCVEATARIKAKKSAVQVIVISPSHGDGCKGADHHLDSHEPHQLLDRLRSLFGDPRKIDGQN
jgi:DNA-binding response OmpR family regulator